ncbi:MAG TPA: DUF883 domain-containing protein [Candidatus Binatia bacterium]|nr:DUF883 domain-containing protein [Candidatus Binatia bacterium]
MSRADRNLGKSADKVATHFREFVDDAEALVRATAHFSGEGLAAARARMEEQIGLARTLSESAGVFARDKAREAANTTDHYVREKPWQAVGMALAAGMLIGFIGSRR